VSRQTGRLRVALPLFALLLLPATAFAEEQRFKLPQQPRPELFGNLLIWRTTANAPVKPVMFPHWSHRLRYTCRVCHLELDFAFKRNTTEITEDANRRGQYCGACHNGKVAFAHTPENCNRCHTGSADIGGADFARLDDLPWARYGNGVDWSRALASGKIRPVPSLDPGFQPIALDTKLTLEAEWNFVPPALFPHAEHVRWLDCANCHPAIFNIKKKTTRHFSMRSIVRGDFCGTCHVRVAFPLDDCRRCHPQMEGSPLQ
jgi:c(7)-type cytochrome triheme protein